VTKAIWVYIKKNKLNAGRIISPDAKLKAVIPAAKSARLLCTGHARSSLGSLLSTES